MDGTTIDMSIAAIFTAHPHLNRAIVPLWPLPFPQVDLDRIGSMVSAALSDGSGSVDRLIAVTADVTAALEAKKAQSGPAIERLRATRSEFQALDVSTRRMANQHHAHHFPITIDSMCMLISPLNAYFLLVYPFQAEYVRAKAAHDTVALPLEEQNARLARDLADAHAQVESREGALSGLQADLAAAEALIKRATDEVEFERNSNAAGGGSGSSDTPGSDGGGSGSSTTTGKRTFLRDFPTARAFLDSRLQQLTALSSEVERQRAEVAASADRKLHERASYEALLPVLRAKLSAARDAQAISLQLEMDNLVTCSR